MTYHFQASLLQPLGLLPYMRCWPCGLSVPLTSVLASLGLMPTTLATTMLLLLSLLATLHRRRIVAARVGQVLPQCVLLSLASYIVLALATTRGVVA
jgi:hypothetical protein